jgi:hypothetical protein
MARRRKDTREWITADDAIFTGDDRYSLAAAFLDGFVDRTIGDSPKHQFKFLRPDGPEEAQAREALVQILRGLAKTFFDNATGAPNPRSCAQLSLVFQKLANLFDGREGPHTPQRELVFKTRGSRRRPHRQRDQSIAWFMVREGAKDGGWDSTVEAARDRYGVSRATVARAWKKYGKVMASPEYAAMVSRVASRAPRLRD